MMYPNNHYQPPGQPSDWHAQQPGQYDAGINHYPNYDNHASTSGCGCGNGTSATSWQPGQYAQQGADWAQNQFPGWQRGQGMDWAQSKFPNYQPGQGMDWAQSKFPNYQPGQGMDWAQNKFQNWQPGHYPQQGAKWAQNRYSWPGMMPGSEATPSYYNPHPSAGVNYASPEQPGENA